MENRLPDRTMQGNSIRAMIDPRFDALVNRAIISTKSNQINPETTSNITSPQINSIASTDSTAEKMNERRRLLSPVCKHRLQGLLIGLLITAISVTIILAVLLTRSTSSTLTSTVSTCDTLRWNPIGITVFGNGSNGSISNELDTPYGVYVDGNDMIYIADSNNHRILSITAGANGTNIGTVVAGITGVPGISSQTLNNPGAIYVDSQKNLYIADTYNCRVQFWPYNASNGSTIAGSSTGICGLTLNELYDIYTLYVDKTKNVYVADVLNSRIVKWSPGAVTGILVAGNGSFGYGSSQLGYPLGVTVDATSGTLYITDFSLDTVVAWPLGATAGTIVAGSNSTQGNTASLLNNPWGILRDSYGNLYISDYSNHRVQMFCATGSSFSSGKTIAGVGLAQSSSMGLLLPAGIAFDSQMNLYVADSANHRIQKFLRII